MSLTKDRWFRRLGFGAIAAVSLGAAAMSTSPAQAHDFAQAHHFDRRAPVVAVHHPSYFPRVVFWFGGHHRDHWDHRDHSEHRWR